MKQSIMDSFTDIAESYRSQFGKITVDLGCGPNKKHGTIGIDMLPLPNVDFVTNMEQGLPFIPDNFIDEYVTVHFLEHINNLELLMKDIHRTLKPNGTVNIIVPHFSNPYYYSDYTHKRFFGLYSFDYFSGEKNKYRRKVPVYNGSFKFSVEKRKLYMRSPNFFWINIFKKYTWTKLFNCCPFMQELYENSFSSFIPCYEIAFTLRVRKE
ncbi:MAG: methyltransferase domain-containing protein [Bacteroidales bacterium]